MKSIHGLAIISLFVYVSTTGSIPVRNTWDEICGNQYLLSTDKATWAQAKSNCELFGGYLAQINGVIENNCLLEYGRHGDMWHSGNDRTTEGVYRWGHTLEIVLLSFILDLLMKPWDPGLQDSFWTQIMFFIPLERISTAWPSSWAKTGTLVLG